jgi:ketosteroid isomerase-like protein
MAASRSADASTSPTSAAVTALREAAERGDADAVASLLAPDVVFHSPFTNRIRFEGKDEVAALHRDIFAVLDDLVTTEPLALGDTRSFTFQARVRGVERETSALVRCTEQGQITDFKVFIRPLPGLVMLFAALPPRVSARRRGRLRATLVAALARPLAFVVRTADRVVPRLI